MSTLVIKKDISLVNVINDRIQQRITLEGDNKKKRMKIGDRTA